MLHAHLFIFNIPWPFIFIDLSVCADVFLSIQEASMRISLVLRMFRLLRSTVFGSAIMSVD